VLRVKPLNNAYDEVTRISAFGTGELHRCQRRPIGWRFGAATLERLAGPKDLGIGPFHTRFEGVVPFGAGNE
jgi:hypothetical protein